MTALTNEQRTHACGPKFLAGSAFRIQLIGVCRGGRWPQPNRRGTIGNCL